MVCQGKTSAARALNMCIAFFVDLVMVLVIIFASAHCRIFALPSGGPHGARLASIDTRDAFAAQALQPVAFAIFEMVAWAEFDVPAFERVDCDFVACLVEAHGSAMLPTMFLPMLELGRVGLASFLL